MDTGTVTIELGTDDLVRIDALIESGGYRNRTDFFRSAVRTQLGKHRQAAGTGKHPVSRARVIGMFRYDRAALERLVADDQRAVVSVLGMVTIARDVSPELASAAIESLRVRGLLRATQPVKDALRSRRP